MTTLKPLKYSKIFIILCKEIERAHKNSLYHTEVSWLSHYQELEHFVTLIYKFTFFFYKEVKGMNLLTFVGKKTYIIWPFKFNLMFQPWMRKKEKIKT